MLFEDLQKIYTLSNVKIYINGILQEVKDGWNYSQFEGYEVRRIEPRCDFGGFLPISKAVTIEPFLEIHLNDKKIIKHQEDN